jgi:hypothetical protein
MTDSPEGAAFISPGRKSGGCAPRPQQSHRGGTAAHKRPLPGKSRS